MHHAEFSINMHNKVSILYNYVKYQSNQMWYIAHYIVHAIFEISNLADIV